MRSPFFPICLSLAIFSSGILAQNNYIPLNRDILLYWNEKKDNQHGFHSSVKPYLESDLQVDSILFSRSLIMFRDEGKNTNQAFHLEAKPLVNTMFGAGYKYISRISGGAEISANYGKKLSLLLRYTLNSERFPEKYSGLLNSGFIPHYGKYFSTSDNSYLFHDFTAYLSWSPLSVVNIQIGKDRNFWGEGYHSLFLSDNANSYPFFKTTFTAWKIKYVSLLAFLKDVNLPANPGQLFPKFSTMQYLSWNATRRLNLSFYESIIYAGNDSTKFAGMDFQYMNPITFYLPVNYSIGSPGKFHLGAGFSYLLAADLKMYGQFLLGEFVLKEFFNGTGWWGNKYAIQLGVKSSEAFHVHGLHLLVEGNLARPYTWSHSSTLSNYGNEMQALAHPLGANFVEFLLEAKYVRNENIFGITILQSVTGQDSANLNFGQNIYKLNSTRVSDYGNKMLQGMKYQNTVINLSYSRMIIPKWNFVMETGFSGYYSKTKTKGILESYFYISLKSLLYNDEIFKF